MSVSNDLLILHDENPESFETLIQTWFYFGLLWEMWTEGFIRVVAGPIGRLISTTLPSSSVLRSMAFAHFGSSRVGPDKNLSESRFCSIT